MTAEKALLTCARLSGGSVLSMTLSLTLPAVGLLLSVVTMTPSGASANPYDAREKVSLHVIAHVGFDRGYQRVLDTALRNAEFSRFGGYTFAFSRFNPSAKVITMVNDIPGEILQHFCGDIFNETSTTILHIINPFKHFRSESAQYVSNLIDHVGLPMITWGPEYAAASSKGQDEKRQVQISPTLHHQAEAMLALLERFGWSQFSVVYTSHPGHMDFLSAVRLIISDRDTYLADNSKKSKIKFNQLSELEIRHPKSVALVSQDLAALAKTDTRIILLFAHEKETRTIVEAAGQQGLMSSEFAWVMAFETIPKGSSKLAADLPVGLLGVEYAFEEKEMNSAVKTAAEIWLRALNNSSYDVIRGKQQWQLPQLQCNSDRKLFWNDGRRFFQYLHNASHTRNNGEDPTYQPQITIVNVQSDNDGGDNRWVEVGNWNRRGLTMNRISWFGGATGPPSGVPERYHLRVVTRPEEPYVIYRNVTGNGTCEDTTVPCRVFPRDDDDRKISNKTIIRCCTGLSIDLMLRISTSLNFDVDLYEVEDFQWGNKDKNGRWDGLIRELLDEHADMSVTSLRISEDRASAISFSEPYLETGITIIVAIREGAISATAFLEPYDYPSWCLILVFSVHTVGTSIFICEWLSPYGMDRGRVRLTEHKFSLSWVSWLMWAMLFGAAVSTDSPREHKFSLFRVFWLMWAMLFGAAVSTDSPRGVSSKFLANIWALFALVFLASYTANLAAFMITKEEYYDLSGIQDWRLQNPWWMKPPFKYGTIPNTSTESNILKNNRDMYQYMQKYRQHSVEDAIYNLKTQKLHAFIYDATVLKYQAGKDAGCRLITVGNWYAMSGYGIAFPVGSPWLKKFNTAILELQKKGETKRLKEVWLAGACHSKQKKSGNNHGCITGGVSNSILCEIERLKEFWLAGACHSKQKKSGNNKGITGGVSSSTLGILNFTSAFILLGAGTGLAALTFLLENLLIWFGRRKLSTWDKKGCCTLISMSMGMTLSFQQSVHDALTMHKTHRCRSRVCENQLWKANHRLDMAKLQIDQLQKEITTLAAEKEARAGEVWRYDPEKVAVAVRLRNGPSRPPPNTDVYINDNHEEPMCPKVTLL